MGLIIYFLAGQEDTSQSKAIITFSIASVSGLVVALLGGITAGNLRIILWTSVILFDIIAALIAGRMEGWNLHPEHFSERYGYSLL